MSSVFDIFLQTEFTAEERRELVSFLQSPTGSKVLRAMLAQKPAVRLDAPSEQLHANAGRARGWDDAVRFLVGLTEKKETALTLDTSPRYPDLDDDSKWDRGLTR